MALGTCYVVGGRGSPPSAGILPLRMYPLPLVQRFLHIHSSPHEHVMVLPHVMGVQTPSFYMGEYWTRWTLSFFMAKRKPMAHPSTHPEEDGPHRQAPPAWQPWLTQKMIFVLFLWLYCIPSEPNENASVRRSRIKTFCHTNPSSGKLSFMWGHQDFRISSCNCKSPHGGD